jgi:hypothetical protein
MRHHVRDTLCRLPDVEPRWAPAVSIFLDMRPDAAPESPGRRSCKVVLKDRLREIEKPLWPRGPAVESLQAAAERLERSLAQDLLSATQGLATFAYSEVTMVGGHERSRLARR